MASSDNKFKPEMEKQVQLALHRQGSEIRVNAFYLFVCIEIMTCRVI